MLKEILMAEITKVPDAECIDAVLCCTVQGGTELVKTTVNNEPDVSAEELAKVLSRAGVPQNVFFFVVLGMISGARKLIFKAVAESCPEDDLHCVDFADQKAGTTLEASLERAGFRFTAVDRQP